MVFHLPTSLNNSILITFDDGPSKTVTPKVVDMLDKYNARAMFFTVGHRIEKCPEVLNLITERGHLLCNHSYSHENSPTKKNFNYFNYFKEIIKCQDLNKEYGKQDLKVFRPPHGRISLTEIIAAKLLRMKIILWSLEGQDWNCQTEEEAIIIGNIMAGKMSGGDIILLHDDNPNVIKILEIVLEKALSQGFKLKPRLGNNLEFL